MVDSNVNANFGRTAFLVDEFAPEFDDYLQRTGSKKDLLLLPLDGRRFRKANYAWTTSGFRGVRQSLLTTAKRSYRSRKLSSQGAARQLNLLRMYQELANSYSRRLTYDVTHVVVQQSLLPFLWRNGQLGGRTFDVLMSALPMHEIQKRLDDACTLHPESKTLGDFRADAELITAEQEALAAARKIITTHTEIASLFQKRADVLSWKANTFDGSQPRPANEKPVVVFPATTVGRKGCYEMREAIRGLDVKLILLGPVIEGSDFWEGFDVERRSDGWLDIADIVVLPAFVEHRPRRLLTAAARGIPVIATPACGVEGVSGVTTVPAGDPASIRELLLARIMPAGSR